jgi:hypothetical protein
MIHIVLVTMILSPENPTYLKRQKSPLVNFLSNGNGNLNTPGNLLQTLVLFRRSLPRNILLLIGTPVKTVYTLVPIGS